MGRIDLKVGYSCNDACVHCVVDDFRDALQHSGRRQDKTFEEIQAELTDARTRGDQVVITGGEPTIRKDFKEILRFARQLGFEILIQSNGRGFSNPDLAEEAARLGGISYCIALHGPNAEVHDAVTTRPGSFAETVQGITNLVRLEQCVTSKVVLSRLNYEVLPQTVERLIELGSCHVSIAFPHAQGRARKLWDQVVPRYRDVVPFLHQALDRLRAAGRGADAETFLFCHMEGYEGHVTEIGQQLEDYVELNQYGSDRGVENWSNIRLQIKEKFPPCLSCRFYPVCEGPWNEYADAYGGEEFLPVAGQRVQHVREIVDGSFRREFPLLADLPL